MSLICYYTCFNIEKFTWNKLNKEPHLNFKVHMILAELGRFGLYQMHKDKWNLIKSEHTQHDSIHLF